MAGFLFAAVAGYLVGLIGSSSNPISGLALTTLLMAALLMVMIGLKGAAGVMATLAVAAVVACVVGVAGDMMQDWKVGHILGGTPWKMQIGGIIGVIGAALILVLPIIVPFITAIINLFSWNRLSVQRAMSVVGSSVLLGSALLLLATIWREGIQAVQIGNWPAPFGITLVSDLFAAIMVVMAGLTGLVVSLYSLVSMDTQRESFGYHTLFHILLMGVCGSFLTGDIFNHT